MDNSDLTMALGEGFTLLGDGFGYQSPYGGNANPPTGQQQPTGGPVPGGGLMSSSGVIGIPTPGSAQAYHQLQPQHSARSAGGYSQSADPLMASKMHPQYPNYGAGAGLQAMTRGQYPTPDSRYGQHSMADYNSGMGQSHLSMQTAQTQPQIPGASAYGQQSLMGQYPAQRMAPSRQTSGQIHAPGMPSHYGPSYPSQPGYHHGTATGDIWSSQGLQHMQRSSYPGYPVAGSGPSAHPSSAPISAGVSMHGPRTGQNQYDFSAIHQQEQQRQYYSSVASSGPPSAASVASHIPSDGSSMPYPSPSQGPYGASSAAAPPPSARGSHPSMSASASRSQYNVMSGYNAPNTLQPPPPPQPVPQTQQSSAAMSRYPQQYPAYSQQSGYGETSAQGSRLSPYSLSQQQAQGPNSPQYSRPGYPQTSSQLSALSPRRPTTTPPAGSSPMPPASHTPDRSSASSGASSQQTPQHGSGYPISPGANHLSSPGQGLSPSNAGGVPPPSSLQQLEQMVMPHLSSSSTNSKASIPSVSSNSSSYYGSVGPSSGGAASSATAPPSPQSAPSSVSRQNAAQNLYSHYPTPANQSQQTYPYHQYPQNNSHWSGQSPGQVSSVAISSTSSATSITNTHSIGNVSGIPLQPQSAMTSMGQTQTPSSNTNLQQHQNSPSVTSNTSPNVSKSDGAISSNSVSGQFTSFNSELNSASNTASENSNYSSSYVNRANTSSSISTSSPSSQPLSSYSVSSANAGTPFDSSVMTSQSQHKQQQSAAQNDTQSQQQSQQQAASVQQQLTSPTSIFDTLKSPSGPRSLSEQLNNEMQQQQSQNQHQQERHSSSSQSNNANPQSHVPPSHQYQQMMQQGHGHGHGQTHQSYSQIPPQHQQQMGYSNNYDPTLNYNMNPDMSQASAMSGPPYGGHDHNMMYDQGYGMDPMVPPQMSDYHRESDYSAMDPYSTAGFDDPFGEPPTKRKGKGRPKKDPNEPKKERKPRQPRAPRGTGRGRGRGNKNNTGDRMPPMMASTIPPDYDPSFAMGPENVDMYSHDMYQQQIPPPQQMMTPQPNQSVPSLPSMQIPSLTPPPPEPPEMLSPIPNQYEQHQHQQTQHLLPHQSPDNREDNHPLLTSPVPPQTFHSSEDTEKPIIEHHQTEVKSDDNELESEQIPFSDVFNQESTSDLNSSINTEVTSLTIPNEDTSTILTESAPQTETNSPSIVPNSPKQEDDTFFDDAPINAESFEFKDEQIASTPVIVKEKKKGKKRKKKNKPTEEEEIPTEEKPTKPKKVKKRKNKKVKASEGKVADECEIPPEDGESSTLQTTQTDFDDITQESSQCESSTIESGTGTGKSGKKEKGSKKERPKRPKIKNKSTKKKLPKLALKFSKNKKRKRLGSSDNNSDMEKTPPPSPDEAESGIQKRRSARNTKRQKYTDDIDLELSEDDDKMDGKKLTDSSGMLIPMIEGKVIGDGNVLAVVANINEDTMVVEKIMSSRMAQREIEIDQPEAGAEPDPNFKAPTIEVEEYFVKYKNLSYFHCEWKTEEELEKGDKRIGQKLKRFKQKKDVMNMFDFLDEEPYNPDYIEVDRILDINEIEEYVIEEIPETNDIKIEKSDTDKDKDPKSEDEQSKDNVKKEEDKSDTLQDNDQKSDEKQTEETEESKIIDDINKDCSKSPKDEKIEIEPSLEKDDKSDDNNDNDNKDDIKKESESDTKEGTIEENVCKNETEKLENDDKDEENKIDDDLKDDNEKKDDKVKSDDDEEVKEKEIEKPRKTRIVKHYLVKWRSLAYEDSTWELEDDIEPSKIESFWKFRNPPSKDKWKPKKRPKPADWKKREESPLYKGGNYLREYQLEGLNWLQFCWHNDQNCILADEMGLGKTIQSIAFIKEICDYGIPGPFLVIAPLSTIGNWQREFETWTDLNVITYHGSSASRNMLQEYEMYYKNDKNERIPGIFKFQVMITTFEIVLTDCLELREIHWRCCIIDEAHRLKNRNCKLLEGLRLLDMEHRVLLTGTPLQNNVEELFSLLNFLEPTQFTSNESFMLEFGDLKTEAQVDKLKAILKPMMLRRLKEDVEKSLAPKEETIVEVELTNTQKKYYRAILERNFQFLSKGGTYANMPNLMNTMMELRKCCIHPFLINGAEEQIMCEYKTQHGDAPEAVLTAIVQASGKLVLIDKLLPRLRANGHRVLIFSQMVRCLDILEDYIVQKRYPYERIDGRVRGNLRQAAIDRFCKPDSDRFVFLLCTRAGGLGINLTAADTVIIFDSDWNPQNDLQAQARCHRIGQSKAVKVYRLICRNTYEREMFDKASLKLGLDRAVLQSMNTSKSASGNLVDNQMSKKEIEDLLRKGAYGAIMEDDNAGDKFCEEDIEQILQRRTHIITIESEGKGSTFSKASFASSNNRSDIEVDDPNFWEKWAKKVNIDVDELKGRNELIVQEPRRRTQTKRFGADDSVLDMSELESTDEDDDSVSMRTRGGRGRMPKGKKNRKGRGGGYERERDEDYLQEFGPGNWTRAECYKVEKGLLTFGWGRWDECLILGNFRRRLSRQDVEDISRVLLLFALQNYKGDEKIKTFIWDLITPNEDGEHRIHRNHSGLSAPVPRGRKNKKVKKTIGEEVESADWAKDDKYNPEVLLTDDMYRKHLHRHANKILLRVRLLYYLKHEIIGELHEQVFSGIPARDIPIPPPVSDGDPPALWWDEDADKSLIVGVYKHGYDRFNLMRQDPALSFLIRCGPPDGAALLAEMNADDDLGKTLDEDDEPETPATPATPLSENDSVKNKNDVNTNKEDIESLEQCGAFLPFPSPADMNHRLRRVVTSYQRNFKKQEMKMAQRARHQQRLERLERFEAAIKEREIKKREQAQKKWSRREEADFYRVISSFGVEYKRDEDRYDWTRFRSFGKLERKLDDTLTEYFKAFYAMCKRVTGRRLTEEEENLPISVDPISEERASRCLARIDLLSKIREEILPHPELDERLQLCQHSMDLPDWWACAKHDKDLLMGAAKYGLNRLDFNLMNDQELSFKDILRQFDISAPDKKPETKVQVNDIKKSDELKLPSDTSETKTAEEVPIVESKETPEEVFEPKSDVDLKTDEQKSEEKSEEKSDDKSEEKSDDKSEEKSDDKSEEKSDNKSKEKSDDKSDDKFEEKSDNKSKEKSDDKSKEKSDDKSDDKLVDDEKSETKETEAIQKENEDTDGASNEKEQKISDDIETKEHDDETEKSKEKETEDKSNENAEDISKNSENNEKIDDESETVVIKDKNEAIKALLNDVKELSSEFLDKIDKHNDDKNDKNDETDEKQKLDETVKKEQNENDNEIKTEITDTEKSVNDESKDENDDKKPDNEVSENDNKIENDKSIDNCAEKVQDNESSEVKENVDVKKESENAVNVTPEIETPAPLNAAQQLQQNKNTIRWPKDRVLQMRLEQICYTVDKNEWPSLRHSFFSLLSGPLPSTPSIATADSSPRPLSPCSLSSASREPTPHPTPEHTPRREVISPLPDFFYPGESPASMNDSAGRRRRRRRRRFEVEAERVKLRNLLSQTIEQQQMPSKKQTSLLSNASSQFLPPLFSLPFCNLRSSLRDELMNDEKTASLLLGTSLQSSLAAAAAAVQASASSQSNNSTSTSTSGGPPPAHQNSAPRRNASMATMDLSGRFKQTPTHTHTVLSAPPAPAHKPAPPPSSAKERNTPAASLDVLDLSSATVPPKRSRGGSPARKAAPVSENKNSSSGAAPSVFKKSTKRIGSRIDALALNLQAKKMMEEKSTVDSKHEKLDVNLIATEKRKASLFMEEINKHAAHIQSKSSSHSNPPAAHSGSSLQSSSKISDSSLLSKSNPFAALDASKLPPSKANEASSLVEQVAIIRQNLRSLFEDHPEFIAQNPSMASMVAASAANVFNPNMHLNPISSIPPNTELLELPEGRRKGRRTKHVEPQSLDMQSLTGEENVSVINRTTGKKITGSKAPPLKHLAEWLDKNPKFDVDPKWNPLIKEKAAAFKTPTSIPSGVRTRTSDKRLSSGGNNSSSGMTSTINSSSMGGSNSSRRATAASLLANQYSNAFGNSPTTSGALNFPSSAALNSLGFNAQMLAAGFPSMKMFMDPMSSTSSSTSSSTHLSKSSSISTTPSSTTTVSSASGAQPLFFPFSGLAGMGLANPLFGFPSFNLPGLTGANTLGSGFPSEYNKKEKDNTNESKSKSSEKSGGGSGKNKNSNNSSGLLGSSAALGSGALPFLYPSPNFLYNPLNLGGFSLPSSPFALAAHTGLMNGLGNLSTGALSGLTTSTTTTSSPSHSSKTKTSSSRASKASHSALNTSLSSSALPSGLSFASSLLASGVHPQSAAAAAAIDSDDDSLKSLMGHDDDDDLNGDFDDRDNETPIHYEIPTAKTSSKKKVSPSKSSSKDLSKSKKSASTSKATHS